MLSLASLILATAALTNAAPGPQAPGTCDTTATPPDKFQLAAVPVYANSSLIALTTTGGGSGLVVIPTSDDTFDGAANFTYTLAAQTIASTGGSNTITSYTSLPLQDSQSLSLSTTPSDDSGLLQITDDGTCNDVSYFVKGDETDVGLYGWTLCNDGALGWVGKSSAEPCEKVALRAYVNATNATTPMRTISAARVMGVAELRY